MVDLYPHQQKAVDQMHNGCILVGDVGTGKTLTSIAYFITKECKGLLHDYNTMRDPKDLYIITTAKKRDSKDWEGDAALLGIGSDPSISMGGVKLTVDSWNNIARYKDVKDAFFIFDEQRVVGAGHWSKMFVKIAKQNRFILLSATPGDTWLDYIPIFLANGFYKNRTAFKDEHVIYNTFAKFPKVERYTGVGKLVKYRNQVLVNMPYERHTTRHLKVVNMPYDESTFEKVVKDRWHVYESRPIRDVAELFSVMRKVVNSDASRPAKIQDLLATHPKLIVFYNFDYELEALRQLFDTQDMSSTSKKTVFVSQPDGIRDGLTTTSSGPWERNPSVQPIRSGTTPQSSMNQTSGSDLVGSQRTNSESGCEKNSSFLSERTRSDGTMTCSEANNGSGMSVTGDESRLTESTRTRSDDLRSSESSPLSASSRDISSNVSTSLSPTSKSGTGSSRTTRNTGRVDTPAESMSGSLREDRGAQEARGKLDQSVRTTSLGGESLGSSFAVAEWNGHKHEEIPKTDSWVYLVQYTAGAEGWNCIETDATVFYSLTYSYKQFYQAQGRIDRLNTPFSDLWYYIFMSDSMIDKAISGSLRTKKSFNESQFATKNRLSA